MTAQTPAGRRLDRDGPVPLDRLLAGRPPPLDVTDHLDEIRAGRRLVVLDDDPTGTQTIADLPVLTSWSVDDLRWALRQDDRRFFVLTNTRSLAAPDAAARNREMVRALDEAARRRATRYALASRGDSTLRGYYPLETDVLADELARLGSRRRGGDLPRLHRARPDHRRLRALDAHRPAGMIPVGEQRVRPGRAASATSTRTCATGCRRRPAVGSRRRWSRRSPSGRHPRAVAPTGCRTILSG